MNATDFLQKRSKINDRRGYPTAHNGILAGSIPAANAARMRDLIAPLASYLHSKLAEFPTSGVRAFHLRSCLLPCFIDFGQRRGEVTRRFGPVYLRLPNSSQGVAPPYSSAEVAMAIGVSLDTFYRTRQIRHERDGLPAPISERGQLKWERTGFDAWLTRHHPVRPKTIASDIFAPPPATTDEEHRERLRTAYGDHGA